MYPFYLTFSHTELSLHIPKGLTVYRLIIRICRISAPNKQDDDDVWCFTSHSTLFKSYQDDGRGIMKDSVQ